jgi:hypothetical protein
MEGIARGVGGETSVKLQRQPIGGPDGWGSGSGLGLSLSALPKLRVTVT